MTSYSKDADRYGNRRVVKMYAQINALRQAIRSHDPIATEEAWDKVEEHIDYVYRPRPNGEIKL